MSEMCYKVNFLIKRQMAVKGRAYCGFKTISGGSRELVMVTVFRIRLEGVF